MISAASTAPQTQHNSIQARLVDVAKLNIEDDMQAQANTKAELEVKAVQAIQAVNFKDSDTDMVQRSKMDLKELEVRSKELIDLAVFTRQHANIQAYTQLSDTDRMVNEVV